MAASHAGSAIDVSDGSFTTHAFAPVPNDVRYDSDSDRSWRQSELTRYANRRHCGASFDHPVGAHHHFTERTSTARVVIERRNLEAEMKALIGCAAIIFAMATVTSVEAKGCLKGAAVGGVAGHVAGHHGVLGAAAGCVIGRHEANKRDRMLSNQTDQPNRELRKGDERL
jgi:hypothetical protein